VAGDAALQVDPENEDELATALVRIGSDAKLRADLAARGRARAARFTWEAAARALVDGVRATADTLPRRVSD